MPKKWRVIIIISVALAVLAGCLLLVSSISDSGITSNIGITAGKIAGKAEEPVVAAQYEDRALFLSPIKQDKTEAAPLNITGLIVPHHLLAADLIAESFAYASAGKYQNVVLLSPDHFSLGQRNVSVTERNFSTVFGELESDREIFRQLKKLSFVGEGDFFYREHGLQASLPFIKYYFPDAKVTAITFRPEVSRFELDQLIGILEKNLPADSLIIQSTDFSHYLTPQQADKYDEVSLKAIESADPENILALEQPGNIDSTAAMYVQTTIQKDFFHSRPDILGHKNSQDYTDSKVASSTSYIAAAYSGPDKPIGEAEFIFVGDIMLSRYIGELMANRQDYDFPFEKIGPLFSGADLVFGNLESPISDKGMSAGHLYSFRADPQAVSGLKEAGFTVLSVANNHAFDYGLEAFSDTLDNLTESGLAYTGGGKDFIAAHQGATLETNGIKTTILAYTDLLPLSEAASDQQAGYAYLDEKQMVEDIKTAKEKSDLVIVSFHWGREYETSSNDRQKRIAAEAATAGASLIVGHHPHVVQEIGQTQGISVAYSLGNFIFDQNFSPETSNGLALRVMVKDRKIESVDPIVINFNSKFQPYLEDGSLSE